MLFDVPRAGGAVRRLQMVRIGCIARPCSVRVCARLGSHSIEDDAARKPASARCQLAGDVRGALD